MTYPPSSLSAVLSGLRTVNPEVSISVEDENLDWGLLDPATDHPDAVEVAHADVVAAVCVQLGLPAGALYADDRIC